MLFTKNPIDLKIYFIFLTLFLNCISTTAYADKLTLVNNSALQEIEKFYGEKALSSITQWQSLVAENKASSSWHQLNVVNKFFNRIPFKEDLKHWADVDYWATPLELLASNGGDCEDYTIAKYVSLKMLGFPEDSLKLLHVNIDGLNRVHMVLAVYEDGETDPLILDSVEKKIRPLSTRTDMQVSFGFNAETIWVNDINGPNKVAGKANQMAKWVEVKNRIKSEIYLQ